MDQVSLFSDDHADFTAGPVRAETLVVFCDGSSLGNPGPGGWCFFIDEQRWAAGGEGHTTNNRMELQAVLAALRWSAQLDPAPALELRCDSRYVIDSVGWVKGWRKRGWRTAKGSPVANRDLHEAIAEALANRAVEFVWVRGHSGDEGNEAADVRAREFASALRAGRSGERGPIA